MRSLSEQGFEVVLVRPQPSRLGGGRRGSLVPDRAEAVASFIGLKQFVKDRLPLTSPLRSLILAQPDEMNRSEALAKMEILSSMLSQELGRE